MQVVHGRVGVVFNRFAFLFLLAALFAGFAISACAVTYDHATWRYRMTVTVETPEGLKTGSAVREVSAFREPKVFSEQTSGHAALTKGEAVVVDLGKRGVLFALMRGGRSGDDYGYRVVFDAFPYPSKNGGGQLTSGGIDYYSHLKAGPVELPANDYPMFVRFKDLNDPQTVEAVSRFSERDFPNGYGGTAKALKKEFGAGVSLKSITIEMTTDPVTAGITKLLPWLTKRDGVQGYLGGSPAPPFEDETKTFLSVGNFIRGMK